MMFALSSAIAKHIGYSSSYDCTSQLQDVQAIDYFFACNAVTQRYDYQSSHEFFKKAESLKQIFHVLIALSYSQRQGHGCLDVRAISAESLWVETVQIDAQSIQVQQNKVIKPGFKFLDLEALGEVVQAFLDIYPNRDDLHWATPYLYTARYFQYEKEIAEYFIEQQKHKVLFDNPNFKGLQNCAAKLWPQLFDLESQSDVDWQLLSVANGLLAQTSIISGGAGTGKTYTVARLLLSWLYMQKANASNQEANANRTENFINKQPKLLLAAPTGKAAQRLNESISEEFEKLKSSDDIAGLVDELSPMVEARTLHRLLGLGMFGIQPRYNEKQPLDCDLLVVDEASMIDVAMMAKLLRALPKGAKLILVGDANQLPSVESGGLLKDLVDQALWRNASIEQVYSAAHINMLCHLLPSLSPHAKTTKTQQLENIANTNEPSNTELARIKHYHYDHVTFLQKSMRSQGEIKTLADTILFGSLSGLQRYLLDRVSQFDVADEQAPQSEDDVQSQSAHEAQLSFNLTTSPMGEDIIWYQNAYTVKGGLKPSLLNRIAKNYHTVFKSNNAFEALSKLQQYRLLSPTKKGRLGTEALNNDIEMQLKKQFSHIQLEGVYKGMPIMVVQNDYRLGLFNGDIGVIWTNKHAQLVACFANSTKADKVKEFSLTVLPKFELVYAMTIHKTQGSEFADVDIVLPSQLPSVSNAFESQHLSKELLYTGVTRAKKSIGLIASLPILKEAVANTSKRYSGLKRQINY